MPAATPPALGAEGPSPGGFRQFFDGLDAGKEQDTGFPTASEARAKSTQGAAAAVVEVRRAVVGRGAEFASPYGPRRLCYADWAASGRALKPVEDFVGQQVLPLYANTHTTTSITGLQSTCFRLEARQAVAQAVNARVSYSDAHSDVVLFAGSGSTGAINKLVQVLGLNVPLPPGAQRPVVIVGPFEHHSNILPWRESHADVVMLPEGPGGRADRDALAAALVEHASRPLVIGSFSAASNVTGVMEDVDAVTEQLHRAGALAFWDYAAAAPYVEIDMNPVRLAPGGGQNPHVYKDALFISTHKLPGGPGAPGVLVAKRRLFDNAVPSQPGGGTVFFVTGQDHRYLSNREEREEGGTQDVVGGVRAGLAFQVKQAVGVAAIAAAEAAVADQLHAALAGCPGLVLLGPAHVPGVARIPIVSFLVRAPDGVGAPGDSGEGGGAASRLLHYNFVCAVLNDVFGVQSRGGCACAGPYGLSLLGISESDARRLEGQLLDKAEALRPGFSRVSLPYFASPAEVRYVAAAVRLVAEHGWRLLPAYRLNPKTGEWRHHTRLTRFPGRLWLGGMRWPAGPAPPGAAAADAAETISDAEIEAAWARQLEEGAAVLARGSVGESRGGGGSALGAGESGGPGEGGDDLRWFAYPWEAEPMLRAEQGGAPEIVPALPPGAFDEGDDEATDPAAAAVTQPPLPPVLGPIQPKVYPSGHGGSAAPAPAPAAAPAAAPAEGGPSGPAPVASRKYPSRAGGAEDRAPGWAATAEAEAESATAAGPEPGAAPACSFAVRPAPGPKPKQDRGGAFIPPQKVLKAVGQAVADWGMIREGDRILLGLSGGKDSLAMLHVLLYLQRRSPVRFELACATVDPGTEAFNPRPLIPYVESLGVPYHYLENTIMEDALCSMSGDSICAFCARMKRGALYTCCRDNGYSTLVLAQHLDDLAESFVMSALHNGQARTMKAAYTIDAGDVRVIRPFVYVRERALKEFSYAAGLPVINENCPACFEEPKERNHVKKLLAREEAKFPDTFTTLCKALVPFMDQALYDQMDHVAEEVQARRKGARSRGQVRASNHRHGVPSKGGGGGGGGGGLGGGGATDSSRVGPAARAPNADIEGMGGGAGHGAGNLPTGGGGAVGSVLLSALAVQPAADLATAAAGVASGLGELGELAGRVAHRMGPAAVAGCAGASSAAEGCAGALGAAGGGLGAAIKWAASARVPRAEQDPGAQAGGGVVAGGCAVAAIVFTVSASLLSVYRG